MLRLTVLLTTAVVGASCAGSAGGRSGVDEPMGPGDVEEQRSPERLQLTVTGCLVHDDQRPRGAASSAAGGGFVLTGATIEGEAGATDERDAAATTYRLVAAGAAGDLAEHTGQRVRVSGRLTSGAGAASEVLARATGMAADQGAPTAEGAAPAPPVLMVQTVEDVAGECPGGTGQGTGENGA